jgi:serine/threonine-protein kinase PknG
MPFGCVWTATGKGKCMTSCNHPDCAGGVLDELGFCGICSRRPRPSLRTSVTSAAGPSMAAGPWWGRGLVVVEQADEPEPALLAGARVPVEQRRCGGCGEPAGRGGRDQGNCPGCRTPFDFLPRLRPGDTLDNGRYRVQGVLSHGGFGWAYLADDTQLGRRVVLKGLINDRVAATVERERRHLTELEHPYIVRIWGYVTEGHYLVLDYVGGGTVRPVSLAEPLEPVLVLGLQLLEALDYLHGKGFLHCDVKPANIVRGGDRVRLIDFGAVRTIVNPKPADTFSAAYCPEPHDPERAAPTVGFDLYCAARTLGELCGAYLDFRDELPGVESLRLLIGRATATAPERRFVSARQFAEQLSGVLQQLVEGQAVPHRSVVFASMTQALDGGLGEVVPMERWVGARAAAGVVNLGAAPFSCPAASQVAGALPTVLPDPWELARTSATTVEAQLNACHAAVGQGNPAAAQALLDEAALPAAEWRQEWYGGLISLARDEVHSAVRAFERVRATVPGELVPLLALGLCAELRGDSAVAAGHYEMVSGTDDSLIAAHFGRARMLLADGRRADAVSALDRVPSESRFERGARIAAARALSAGAVTDAETAAPTDEDVERARDLRAGLKLDELSAALLEIELAQAEAGGQGETSGPARLRLERALRRLATFAPSERSHTALIDLANGVRPVTVWSW